MMYWFNKIAFLLVCPTTLIVALVVVGYRTRRLGWLILAVGFAWFCATCLPCRLIGVALENEHRVIPIEQLPSADAIVVLGGGVYRNKNVSPYPEMSGAADRVWHAARLWKAGKASLVIVSGSDSDIADAVLLADFGVPKGQMLVDAESRNTQENAQKVKALLPASVKSVLLVTSAWHMSRAKATFQQVLAEVEIYPAATDYAFSNECVGLPWYGGLLPDSGYYHLTSILLKELLGRLATMLKGVM